tara:strand:+ start:1067 stop:1348 length:282 start_codon:yes stop_codon:yes gene_type:complete
MIIFHDNNTYYYMKEKNLLVDNHSKSLEELTKEINEIIKKLENEKNLENSLDEYQKLIKLNNILEKKFQKKGKNISQNTKQKINNIVVSKNEK